MLDDLTLFHLLAERLVRSPAAYTSLCQLSKRLRLSDDKVRRTLGRLEEHCNAKLIGMQNRCLALTVCGQRLHTLVKSLDALADPERANGPLEIVTLAVDNFLAESLVPRALTAFLSAWGGLASVRLCPLCPASLNEQFANRDLDFALGWREAEPRSAQLPLDARFPWVVLTPLTHPLTEGTDTLEPSALARVERLFVPAEERCMAALADVFRAMPPARRIECDSFHTVRAMVAAGHGLGIGLEMIHQVKNDTQQVQHFPLRGIAAEQAAIFLPRKTEKLSEAARTLITALQQAVTAPALSAKPDQETDTQFVNRQPSASELFQAQPEGGQSS